jgi:hypothetical protein
MNIPTLKVCLIGNTDHDELVNFPDQSQKSTQDMTVLALFSRLNHHPCICVTVTLYNLHITHFSEK